MKEHTSQGLSRRLWDAGFSREHTYVYDRKDSYRPIQDKRTFTYPPDYHYYIPAYTFTELWKPLDMPNRYELLKHIQTCFERDDLAEVAGEWLINNMEVEG